MADDKNKKNGNIDADPTRGHMPEGFTEQDLEVTGGLDPLAPAKISFENKSPVFGVLIGAEDMPPRPSLDPVKRKAGIKEDWVSFVVLLTAPTKGQVGKDGPVQDVPAGKIVRIPETGNLTNNRDLLRCAYDKDNVYLARFTVLGQRQVNDMPTPMWDYEVKIAKSKPVSRSKSAAYSLAGINRNAPALGQGDAPRSAEVPL